MRPLKTILVLLFAGFILIPCSPLHAQSSIQAYPVETPGLTYQNFKMISGSGEFRILSERIPQLIGLNLINNNQVIWIEPGNQFPADSLLFELTGSFSEYKGQIYINAYLQPRMEGKSTDRINLGSFSGPYSDLFAMSKNISTQVLISLPELLEDQSPINTVAIICYTVEDELQEEFQSIGEELTISLIGNLQENNSYVILPYRQIREYCSNRRPNDRRISNQLNVDAIISGKLTPTDKNRFMIEPYLWIKRENKRYDLIKREGDLLDYFSIEEKLIEDLTDLLKINVDSSRARILEGLEFTSDNSTDYFTMAMNYYNEGHSPMAIFLFKKALVIDPDDYTIIYNLGVLRQEEGNIEIAYQSYKRSLQLKPDFPDALVNLGGIEIYKGNYKEALDCYERVLKSEPDFPGIHKWIGEAYLLLKDNKKAIQELELARQADPNDIEILDLLAQAYFDAGNLTLSLQLYKQLETLDRTDEVVLTLGYIYNELGINAYDMEKYETALDHFKNSAGYNPQKYVYRNVMLSLYRLKKFQEGRDWLKKGLNINVFSKKDAYYNYGLLLLTLYEDTYDEKYIDEAYALFKAQEWIDPGKNMMVYYHIGLVFDYKWDIKNAVSYYEKSLQIAYEKDSVKQNPWIISNLAYEYYRLREFKKSIEYNSIILDMDPDYLIAYYIMAYSYAAIGDLESALHFYSQLNQRLANPKIVEMANNGGEWFWHADSEFIYFKSISKKKAYGLYGEAMIAYLMDNKQEARKLVKEAGTIYDDSDESLMRLINHELDILLEEQEEFREKIQEFRVRHLNT